MKQMVKGVLCAALVAAVVSGAARAEERHIGVVNVSSVFSSYARVKDVQETLKKEFDPQQKEISAEEAHLKDLTANFQSEAQLSPDAENDPKLFRSKQNLDKRTFDYKAMVKKVYTDIEERRKNEMKSVLKDIKKTIREIAVGQKFDLVLRAPEFAEEFDKAKAGADPAEDEPKTAAELVRRFRENPVLYFSTGVDITSQVIDQLNADYRANSKPAAPAPK
jgi:Skp family chaperone for outer membrane proteins